MSISSFQRARGFFHCFSIPPQCAALKTLFVETNYLLTSRPGPACRELLYLEEIGNIISLERSARMESCERRVVPRDVCERCQSLDLPPFCYITPVGENRTSRFNIPCFDLNGPTTQDPFLNPEHPVANEPTASSLSATTLHHHS